MQFSSGCAFSRLTTRVIVERAFHRRRARRRGAWPPDLGLLEVGLLGFFLNEMGCSDFKIFFVWIGCIVFLD